MKHDGITLTRNGDIGWRMSNPKEDFDRDGRAMESNYVSFVRIKDCGTYKRDGQTYYEPKGVKCIPVNHGGTYYGYGEWKKRKVAGGKWMNNNEGSIVFVHEYWQCTKYLVNDARVYTASLKRVENPK
jgi:hypothetical protein